MADIRHLTDRFAVAPQIAVGDVAEIAAAGFGFIVNNRPEGEQPGQPDGEDIETAALAAGLGYLAIPVDHGGFSAEQVAALSALMASDRRILAFCRSGTRSAMLWALALASRGGAVDDIAGAAGAAGYDVRPLEPLMRQLGAA